MVPRFVTRGGAPDGTTAILPCSCVCANELVRTRRKTNRRRWRDMMSLQKRTSLVKKAIRGQASSCLVHLGEVCGPLTPSSPLRLEQVGTLSLCGYALGGFQERPSSMGQARTL